MKYNLTKQIDFNRFVKRTKQIINRFKSDYDNQYLSTGLYELTEINVRTMSQHKYIHVLFKYFAGEQGCDTELVKQYYFKEKGGNDLIFLRNDIDKLTGEQIVIIRSVNDLSKDEMSTAIDNFITWALVEPEIVLPKSDEYRFLSVCIVENDKHVNLWV